MAEKALASGDYERAREVFQEVLSGLISGHPEWPRALVGLARAYEGLGELEKAREFYQKLADASPAYRDLALRKLVELAEPEVE